MSDHADLLKTLDLYASGADAHCMVSQAAADALRELVPKAAALDALEAAWQDADRTTVIAWAPVDPESGRGGYWLVNAKPYHTDLASAIRAALERARE